MAENINKMIVTLVDCRVYNDSKDLIGVANVDLPQLQPMTSSVSGIGIAGEVDFPVLGHYQSMTCTLHWKGIEKAAFDLSTFKAQSLEIRGEQQGYDSASGTLVVEPVRVVLRAIPKNLNLGGFTSGERVEAETEFEVLYIKMTVGGKEVCEIDKFNYVAKIGGTDYLQKVRADLGIG